MVPVVKKGRKPGRGGRGKSRGGGRGGGRPQNLSTSTTPTAIVGKRERSPSVDSSKAAVRGKTAKLIPLSTKKSQESPRSLRSRGQNQSCPSPADEAPTTIQNPHQRSSRRRTEPDDAEMRNSSFGSPNRSMPPTVPKNESTKESIDSNGKRIPRLIDVSAAQRREALSGVTPLEWTTQDVAQFLRVNDCTAYCDTFTNAVSIEFRLKGFGK